MTNGFFMDLIACKVQTVKGMTINDLGGQRKLRKKIRRPFSRKKIKTPSPRKKDLKIFSPRKKVFFDWL